MLAELPSREALRSETRLASLDGKRKIKRFSGNKKDETDEIKESGAKRTHREVTLLD